MRRRLEEARLVTDQKRSLIGAGPDYFVIRRQVPVKKGKWPMVSKEVEEAEGEN
jgi:hypothetical protein